MWCLLTVAGTRWFKYDRDWLCVNKSQYVRVIFEPPCIIHHYWLIAVLQGHPIQTASTIAVASIFGVGSSLGMGGEAEKDVLFYCNKNETLINLLYTWPLLYHLHEHENHRLPVMPLVQQHSWALNGTWAFCKLPFTCIIINCHNAACL
jgi:hypothetical protein